VLRARVLDGADHPGTDMAFTALFTFESVVNESVVNETKEPV
jgi:hypothetical protein